MNEILNHIIGSALGAIVGAGILVLVYRAVLRNATLTGAEIATKTLLESKLADAAISMRYGNNGHQAHDQRPHVAHPGRDEHASGPMGLPSELIALTAALEEFACRNAHRLMSGERFLVLCMDEGRVRIMPYEVATHNNVAMEQVIRAYVLEAIVDPGLDADGHKTMDMVAHSLTAEQFIEILDGKTFMARRDNARDSVVPTTVVCPPNVHPAFFKARAGDEAVAAFQLAIINAIGSAILELGLNDASPGRAFVAMTDPGDGGRHVFTAYPVRQMPEDFDWSIAAVYLAEYTMGHDGPMLVSYKLLGDGDLSGFHAYQTPLGDEGIGDADGDTADVVDEIDDEATDPGRDDSSRVLGDADLELEILDDDTGHPDPSTSHDLPKGPHLHGGRPRAMGPTGEA